MFGRAGDAENTYELMHEVKEKSMDENISKNLFKGIAFMVKSQKRNVSQRLWFTVTESGLCGWIVEQLLSGSRVLSVRFRQS